MQKLSLEHNLEKGDKTMKKAIYLSIMFCVAIALVLNVGEAQKRTGTASATELLIPVGSRGLAMSGANIANTFGVDAIHWNPAGLGRMKFAAEGMISRMNYIADINVNYGAVAGSFGGFGVVGFSVKSLDFGDIPLTTEDDPENESQRFFSPGFVTVGLSYARLLTDAISVGGTVKLVSEKIERVSAATPAIDFGVLYRGLVGIRGLNLGVAVKNIGPQMKYDGTALYRNAVSSDGRRPEQKYKSEAASFELPSVVEIGLSYDGSVGENMVWTLGSTFSNNNLYLDEYRIGGEVGYVMESFRIYGRAGYNALARQQNDNIFKFTVGGGISYAAPGIDITFDYAYRDVDFFTGNQMFSLKLGF